MNADQQIEAEALADISESFDIEAVPSVLLLRVSDLSSFVTTFGGPPCEISET